MLTQCEKCGAVFRLQAEQLRKAHGHVRCGVCQQVFNAVARLIDEPEPVSGIGTMPPDLSAWAAPPGSPKPFSPSVAIVDKPVVAGAGERLPEVRLSEAEHAILFTAPGSAAHADAPPDPPVSVTDRDPGPHIRLADLDAELGDLPAEVPPVLQQEMMALRGATGGGRRFAWYWLAASLLLLVVLALQIGWHFREALLAQRPEWRAPFAELCRHIGCRVAPDRNPAAIELTARDVRDHPQFKDALLVNATLVNRATIAQGYPVIELSLFDRAGRPLGVRRFNPPEYLDQSIDAGAGIPPVRPVFIVLEIAVSSAEAASFEFRFL